MSAPAKTIEPTGCCPPFDPSQWDDKEIVWRDKPFVHEHVTSVLHVPLNMRSKMTKAMRLIDAAHAKPDHPLTLADERSPWSSELLVEVTKVVEGADVQLLSGTFLTKVFEGPFRDADQWMEDMKRHVARKGRTIEKMYFGYTTCPKCAKAYGKNYVVMLAKVEDRATSAQPDA